MKVYLLDRPAMDLGFCLSQPDEHSDTPVPDCLAQAALAYDLFYILQVPVMMVIMLIV